MFSKNLRLFSLHAASSSSTPTPNSHSSTPIFLPFLQDDDDDEEEEEEEAEDLQELEEEEEEEDPDDPILRFFKSRSSTQDPQREGKLSLQKNRRSSWRLADDTQLVDESETDSGIEGVLEQQREQARPLNFDSRALSEEIVEEILQKARTLPQNLTLGEVLGGFEGRVGEKESVKVLELMGKEGLLMGCLYFYEWMGLQETSLVTPRACSVLFPMLGRAGMGDKLMILFRNLPAKKEFRDVHVYNAAISGLMCSKRYDMLDTFFFSLRYSCLWSICSDIRNSRLTNKFVHRKSMRINKMIDIKS